MSIHKHSIRAILFFDGSTKKDKAKRSRRNAKQNALPSAKEIKRIQVKKPGKRPSPSALLGLVRDKKRATRY